MQLEKNQLSGYSSYNYVWTLAVLTEMEVNTASYLNRDPSFVVIKTGGITKIDGLRTQAEAIAGINVEYYIDDVDIESLYSPNPKSGVTTATSINFKIYEPYSVGLFFQTLALASIQAGYGGSFTSIPVLLRCEFIGYDSSGNIVKGIVRDLALSLVNATFTVSAGGAVYSVESIPWNHLAWGDEIQKIKKDDKMVGYTVEEVLNTGSKSLVSYLNKAEDDEVAAGAKLYKNEYIIEFPDSLGNYSATSMVGVFDPVTNPGGVDLPLLQAVNIQAFNNQFNNTTYSPGYGEGQVDPGLIAAARATTGNVSNSSRPTPVMSIRSDGSVSGMPRTGLNSIGSSLINDDFNYMGNQEFALDLPTYDPQSNTVSTGSMFLSADRLFSFRQGTPIEQIIESVILTSNYTRDVIEKLEIGGDTPIEWFRIESQVFLKNNGNSKQFVYRIIPYTIDRSLFEKQGSLRSYSRVLGGVKKGFNYIYTGLNTEIINFDISINLAFFQTFLSDVNSSNTQVPLLSATTGANNFLSVVSALANTGLNVISTISDVFGAGVASINPRVPPSDYSTIYSTYPTPGGAGINDARSEVAKHFHNTILNSSIELININLEILGDPFFLPDSGMGNHQTVRGMEYQQSEVDVILHFATPVDISSTTGRMTMTSVDQFIGLYKIVKISHSFSGGQFKQVLEMLRRPGQDETTISMAKALLIEKDLGQTIPGLQDFLSSGTQVTPSNLIYSALFDGSGVNSFLTKVSALRNLSNVLPLPDDLLKVFDTITNFGSKVIGITNAFAQVTSNVESIFQNTSSLFRNIQSGFQTNVASIAANSTQTTLPTRPGQQTSGPART
jgi:hypothetical protein